MPAMLSSSEIAETASASMVHGTPLDSLASVEPPQPNLADIGRLPATIMVPPRRSGMFAAIGVDDREARLLVARLASDGSFRTIRQERESFAGAAGGGGPPAARSSAALPSRWRKS